MSRVPLPSEDEQRLVKVEQGLVKQLRKVISADRAVSSALDDLVRKVEDAITEKTKYVDAVSSTSEMMEHIAQNPAAHITRGDVAFVDTIARLYGRAIESNKELVQGLKDVLVALKPLQAKKDQYETTYGDYVDLFGDVAKAGNKYLKKASKMEADDKLKKLEAKIRAQTADLRRLEDARDSQMKILREEAEYVKEAWARLKKSHGSYAM